MTSTNNNLLVEVNADDRDLTIRLPIHAGADAASWLCCWSTFVLPAASVFCPELVLISAGFDAHRDDPLGDCRLDSDDFARMACHVRDFARRVGAPWGRCWRGLSPAFACRRRDLVDARAGRRR